ncbi:hypothetical protein D3C84_1094010 [compost metagenome]
MQQLQAGHVWQAQVEQDQVEVALAQTAFGLGGILRGMDLQARAERGQGQAEAVEEDPVVIHQQQAEVFG